MNLLIRFFQIYYLLGATFTFGQQTIYFVDDEEGLYSQEVGSCETTFIGSTDNVLVTVVDIAYDPDESVLYGVSPSGHLLKIDVSTGHTEYFDMLGAGGLTSLAYKEGKLYFDSVINGTALSSRLYSYEISTGTVEEHGTFDEYLGDGDLAFLNDKLYMLAKGAKFLEVNIEDPASSDIIGYLPYFQNWGMIPIATDCDNEIMLVSNYYDQYTLDVTILTDAIYCEDLTENLIFGMAITPYEGSFGVTVSEPTCYGFSDGSITIHIYGESDEPIFEITDTAGTVLNVDNSNTANSLSSGWYYFSVTDDLACSGLDSVFLSDPDQLEIDLTVIGPACNGEETATAVVNNVFNYTGAYDQISYVWTPNPSGNDGIGEDSTWALPPGDYIITINDENGCSRSFDFIVSDGDLMDWAEFGIYPAQCRTSGTQNGNGVVYGAATGGAGDFEYHWENDDDPADFIDNVTTWGGRNPGTYTLTATDGDGCVLTKTVELDSVSPKAIFTINSDQLNTDCEGTANVDVEFINESIHFADPTDPTADTTFFWNLDTTNTAWQLTHDYFEVLDTTYAAIGQSYQVDVCLVALNKNGCKDTTCKAITIYQPIIFTDVNVFTPNNDGFNDLFTFKYNSVSISEFNCVVVNRWGEVITELFDISEGWDGNTKNNTLCPDGVYFYTYSAIANNGIALQGQGNIHLLR